MAGERVISSELASRVAVVGRIELKITKDLEHLPLYSHYSNYVILEVSELAGR